MSSNILSNARTIWGVGLLAFALLCCLCIYGHAPQFANLGATAGPAAAPAATSLEARLINGKVTLTGTLPDQVAKAQVIARAQELYGAGNFIDNLQLSGQTAFPSPGWFNAALALLPLANRVNTEGGFAMDGSTVTVRGLVESEALKSQLMSQAMVAAGSSVRVEDKVLVRGQVTAAQTTDFQAQLNQMIAGKIVEFASNSEVLTDQGKAVLNDMVQVLREVPGLPVEIGGHTDASGNATLNETLSQRRARTCLQYLVQKGIAANRLSARGYGSSQPVADNNTLQGKQRNRRIEFTVRKEGK